MAENNYLGHTYASKLVWQGLKWVTTRVHTHGGACVHIQESRLLQHVYTLQKELTGMWCG